MRIIVTGANGFVGKTLMLRLAESGWSDVIALGRDTTPDAWHTALDRADFVFHLAGVNRPQAPEEFEAGNVDLTARICERLVTAGRRATIVLSSSTQATLDNPYGRSKLHSEAVVQGYADATSARACVIRLPNIFGKWARPNYNSAVATFCHNIALGLPISIHDPAAPLRLVYIDDVIDTLIRLLSGSVDTDVSVSPVYEATVGEVAAMIRSFAASRSTLRIPRVGSGLVRALYATYVSYLSPANFDYPLIRYEDPRGAFSEMLRTEDSGQFSCFTAHPGITRGGHYHHTKTEKFLVVQGRARFGFRHVLSGEVFSLEVEGAAPRVVETVPGWAHDITNIGDREMVVLLWANEIFDPARPDTVTCPVNG